MCTGELLGRASWKGVGPQDRKGGESLGKCPLEVSSVGLSRESRRDFSDWGWHRFTAVSPQLRAAPDGHELPGISQPVQARGSGTLWAFPGNRHSNKRLEVKAQRSQKGAGALLRNGEGERRGSGWSTPSAHCHRYCKLKARVQEAGRVL